MNNSQHLMNNLSTDARPQNIGFSLSGNEESVLLNSEISDDASQVFNSEYGINHLVTIAAPLFALNSRLEFLKGAPILGKDELLKNLIHEVKVFTKRARQLSYHSNVISAASLSLCSLIDETIINTSWGENLNWREENLCKTFYRKTNDDEKFFLFLEMAHKDPALYLDLLELLYLCLRMGFTGKYRTTDPTYLHNITGILYNLISRERGDLKKGLYITDEPDKNITKEENSVKKSLSKAVLISISVFITFTISLPLAYFAFNHDRAESLTKTSNHESIDN